MGASSEERGASTVLLTGATGFLGRRLLPRLLARGHTVRAVSRRPAHALSLPEHERLQTCRADVLDAASLRACLEGVDAAIYLVHSMEGGVEQAGEFIERDRRAALNFAEAAQDAGVSRILYVSGLKPTEYVSDHLSSRNDVEGYLGEYGVPVTVIRAGFIIGAGSAGFEMMKGITGKMGNTMTLSSDFRHRTQPAFAGDVVEALVACVDHPAQTRGQVFEVGSHEVVEYIDIVRAFCACAGKEVDFLEVPWVPHDVAAAYVASSSGLSYALIRALIEGLHVDLFVTNERLYQLFPELPRTSPHAAMQRAFEEDEAAR